MRVLICGSRTVDGNLRPDPWVISNAMWALRSESARVGAHFEVISGGALGTDRLAEQWCRQHGVPVTVVKPDYKAYGAKAPLVRNTQMLYMEPDLVYGFWDGVSTGTKHMLTIARKAGVPVKVHKIGAWSDR